MIRRPPRSTLSSSSAASDVYKRQAPLKTVSAVSFIGPCPQEQSSLCKGVGLAASIGDTLYSWDAFSETCTAIMGGHEAQITAVTRGPRGHWSVITGSKDRTARAWDASNNGLTFQETRNCLKEFRGHSQPVSCVGCLGSQVVTGSVDFNLRIWNFSNELCMAVIEHQHVVRALCVHDNVLWSVSFDGWLNRIEHNAITPVHQIRFEDESESLKPWALSSLSREGFLVACTVGGTRSSVLTQIDLESNSRSDKQT
eukprot:TRINITY_DN33322_c0_g1_i1.p1 TRINITY_DN33322_c0_g1~~TRINITY_DN33322_c0_g1_i1.p1  ORF type:complete len:255 (+),score=40.75 TRINITY_DN33322_c0_g1_i1:57-821(+)